MSHWFCSLLAPRLPDPVAPSTCVCLATSWHTLPFPVTALTPCVTLSTHWNWCWPWLRVDPWTSASMSSSSTRRWRCQHCLVCPCAWLSMVLLLWLSRSEARWTSARSQPTHVRSTSMDTSSQGKDLRHQERHYCDVPWMFRRLKLQTTRLFVQQLLCEH